MQGTLRELQRVMETQREKGSPCGWDKEKELEVIPIDLHKQDFERQRWKARLSQGKEMALKECKNRKQEHMTHVQEMVKSLVWLKHRLVGQTGSKTGTVE